MKTIKPVAERFTSSGNAAACYVCGEDAREGWFARINTAKGRVCLCSAACALMFFQRAKAPAHDHQAQHIYRRARTAIVQAARYVEALEGKSASPGGSCA